MIYVNSNGWSHLIKRKYKF